MNRFLPAALLVAVSFAALVGVFVRVVECPDCDPKDRGCLRCDERGRITLWESRRPLLAKDLLTLLYWSGPGAHCVGDLAEEQDRPRHEVMGWKAWEE
jgi:hypothetical protein